MTFVVPSELSASFPAGMSVTITVVSGSFDEVISPLAIVFCWLAAGISTAAAAVSRAGISTAATSPSVGSRADTSPVSEVGISTAETGAATASGADISTAETSGAEVGISAGETDAAGCCATEVSVAVSAFCCSG